jgi:hypothetical protein
MKLSEKSSGNFTPADEGTFRAVCVDVTPPEVKQTKFGPKEMFRVVFEIDAEREDGGRQCVWSRAFTVSLNEKASFRKFLRQWRGRDLNAAEKAEFDTESLIGLPATLVIVHEESEDGTIYANLAACTPHKNGEALEPSGDFVRKKDKEAKGGNEGGEGAGYRKAATPTKKAEPETEPVDDTQAGADWSKVKVHVGKHSGIELRDLDIEAIEKLHSNWLPIHKQNPRPTADDKRLAAALEKAIEEIQQPVGATEDF